MAAKNNPNAFASVMSEYLKKDKDTMAVEQAAIKLESTLKIELPTLDAEIAKLKLQIKAQENAVHDAIYSLNPNLRTYDEAKSLLESLNDQLTAATEKKAERQALLEELFPA